MLSRNHAFKHFDCSIVVGMRVALWGDRVISYGEDTFRLCLANVPEGGRREGSGTMRCRRVLIVSVL